MEVDRVRTLDRLQTRVGKLRAQAQAQGYGAGIISHGGGAGKAATAPIRGRGGVPWSEGDNRRVQSAPVPVARGGSARLRASMPRLTRTGGSRQQGTTTPQQPAPHAGPVDREGMGPPVHARNPTLFLKRDDGAKVRRGDFKPGITQPEPPPRTPGVLIRPSDKKQPRTRFRSMYEGRSLPVKFAAGGGRSGAIIWINESPEEEDRSHLVPVFFDGLREYDEPYRFIAITACRELIPKATERGAIAESASAMGESLLQICKDREPSAVAVALELMTQAMGDEGFARGLLPSLKKLLGHLQFYSSRKFEVDMGYNSRRLVLLSDAVQDFLEGLEAVGDDATLGMIKRAVPKYSSAAVMRKSMDAKRAQQWERTHLQPSAGA